MTTRKAQYTPGARVVLLFSGGLESTTLAELALREQQQLHCLFVRYGQQAAPFEYRAAETWFSRAKFTRKAPVYFNDVSLGGIKIDNMNAPPGATGPRYVPARNMLLLSLAANFASSINADEVWYGAHRGDREDYADCRPDFVKAMGRTMAISEGLRLRAPLLLSSRAQVRELASSLGIDRSMTWSCYAPEQGRPCKRCNSCLQDLDA